MAYSKDEPMVSRPNAKYEHLYVIVRWDPDVPEPENAIAVTKAFDDEALARDEAARLNDLNGGIGCRYL
jgi:hypothetical protein